jgi:23S rRNA pseudouridine1911/1915/1917 synthase
VISSKQNSAIIELVVPRESARLRLDRFLAANLPQFSRSRLQQLIRDGFVRVNGAAARPSDSIRTRDKIDVTEPPPVPLDTPAQAIDLKILFEDDDLIVLDKPPGLVVHPGAGHRDRTLVNGLLHHCPNLSGIGGEERPGIVHRLDKDTSGCIVVAKNDQAHRDLAAQFAARTIEKIYLALVAGKLPAQSGTIDENISRHRVHRQRMTAGSARGRAAKTEYRVLREGPAASLIECRLHSGRTHQIRVHLHHFGHPVLGDKLYAPKFARNAPRQMLHAWKLGFTHPRTGEWQNFEAPVPDDFEETLLTLGL